MIVGRAASGHPDQPRPIRQLNIAMPYSRRMIPNLAVGGREISVNSTLVMGVVNASPESFSDGGRFMSLTSQLELAASLVESGADIIDVGGQSAVTNQPELDANIEAERVVPIVEWLRGTYPDVLVSVDTYRPAVAIPALAVGAQIINDVSGLLNPELASSCAEYQAALVIMHTAARPKVRLQDPALYVDVVTEVLTFLKQRIEVATTRGCVWIRLLSTPDRTSPRLRTKQSNCFAAWTWCVLSEGPYSWRSPGRISSVQ